MAVSTKENPDTFLVDYTADRMIDHLLLIEDHFLDFAREPSAQCLACVFWHLQKLVAYSSLECVKFEGMDKPLCQELSAWASRTQDAIEHLAKDQALQLAKDAREYRYKMVETADVHQPTPCTKEDVMSTPICEHKISDLKQVDPVLDTIGSQVCGAGLCKPGGTTVPVCTKKRRKVLERCIRKVKRSNRKVNPFAVCTASVGCKLRQVVTIEQPPELLPERSLKVCHA